MRFISYRDVGTGISSVLALFKIIGLGCFDIAVKARFKCYQDTLFANAVSN